MSETKSVEFLPHDIITVHDGKATTTSQAVAQVFGKDHAHIMRDIRKLNEIQEVASQSNFGLASYRDEQGKERPCYELTKKGFMLLAMGYNTPECIRLKMIFLDRFEEQERLLSTGGFSMDRLLAAVDSAVAKRYEDVRKITDENLMLRVNNDRLLGLVNKYGPDMTKYGTTSEITGRSKVQIIRASVRTPTGLWRIETDREQLSALMQPLLPFPRKTEESEQDAAQ